MNNDNGYETNPKHKYKPSTIIAIGQDKPKADKARHYVDKEEFYNELVIRKEQMEIYKAKIEAGEDAKPPRVSEKAAVCIMKICENLAKKYNFAKIDYKDMMISAAIEQCIRYIDSFDINKTKNPFSYFTQTAYYSYLDYIKDENEKKAVKYRSILDSMALQEYIEHDLSENTEHVHDNFELPDIEYMRSYVDNYGKAKEKKNEQQKQTKSKKVSLASSLDDIWAS